MKFKFSVIILTVLCYVCLCKSSPPVVKGFTIPAKTSVPFTYCIDYTKVPDVPSNLNRLRDSPPDLYHISYHIPFKAALGPTYGHELYTNDILKPQDIGREVDRVQTLIQRIKNTGVDFLIPYVYTMAFFGLPDQRTGFFNFYDHWEVDSRNNFNFMSFKKGEAKV